MTRSRLMRPTEVAELFDVETDTVLDWARAGKLPAVRTPGGHWRFDRAAVEDRLSAASTGSDQ